jgi:hypothetical protein
MNPVLHKTTRIPGMAVYKTPDGSKSAFKVIALFYLVLTLKTLVKARHGDN